MIKKILKYLLFGAVIAAVIICEAASSSSVKGGRRRAECCGINIENRDTTGFLSEDDVCRIIEARFGKVVGAMTDSIPVDSIEFLLDSVPAVKKSQVWMTGKGTVQIRIDERTPVVRLIGGASDRMVFADMDRVVFEAPRGYKARFDIPVFNLYSEEDLHIAFTLYEALQSDKVLHDRLEKLETDEKGKCVLTLKYGKERYLFGDFSEISSKIGKIKTYLNTIKPAREEKRYKTVNLAFENQIICK